MVFQFGIHETQKLFNRLKLLIFFKKLIILSIFLGGFFAFFFLGFDQYLNFTFLKANREKLLAYTLNHYLFMLLIATTIYTISTALSLPLASLLSLTIGFLFGLWVGISIILFSATLGATLVFLAARYIWGEAIQRKMGGRIEKFLSEFHRNDFNYLLFLRLVPIFPFWLINLAMAFTPIRLKTYIGATFLGIIPGAFVFTNLGRTLGRIESPDQLVSLKTMSAFFLLGIFALIPVVTKKIRAIK
jgi:uncharacterized membrane protein YdjX (TVP38/TMEM64 family)